MMAYNYGNERPFIFTERGQVMFLKIRDRTQMLLKAAGAARFQEICADVTGDSWSMLACVDRLVELGEIYEVTTGGVSGQHRIFAARVLP